MSNLTNMFDFENVCFCVSYLSSAEEIVFQPNYSTVVLPDTPPPHTDPLTSLLDGVLFLSSSKVNSYVSM